jgi:hypothetical protein
MIVLRFGATQIHSHTPMPFGNALVRGCETHSRMPPIPECKTRSRMEKPFPNAKNNLGCKGPFRMALQPAARGVCTP